MDWEKETPRNNQIRSWIPTRRMILHLLGMVFMMMSKRSRYHGYNYQRKEQIEAWCVILRDETA